MVENGDFIPVSEPLIGDNVLPRVQECIETGWVSSQGRFIHESDEPMLRVSDT
jgi:perosamine synthetase